jgi:protease-4
MVGLNVEGLLGKIGVKPQTFKAGEHKDLLSPFRGATPEERRIVQGIIDGMHSRFVGVVKASRPSLDEKRLGELTDGRIFDAARALDAGLVDQVGDLRAAIDVARVAANVEKARVVRYRRPGETAESIYSAAGAAPLQVNLLPIDLGTLAVNSPRFMYLWAPGLSSGLAD